MPRDKVISVLRDRPEIEATLRALARARTESESRPCLQALAGWGASVVPVIVSMLDTPDPWMVRALGRAISQVRERERAAGALRRAILSPVSSDRRRIVAMVLLDQFLHQPLDEALFSALGDPLEVGLKVLLSETPPTERSLRLDYLSIIHAQSLQEVLFALERFRRAGSDAAVEAIRFFALDEREAVAGAALEALGTIRRTASLWALRTLLPNVPPASRAEVERLVRKLLLGGVPDEPLPEPPPGARCLLSPPDGAGGSLLLFLFPAAQGYQVLHVFLDEEVGVRGAYEIDCQPADIAAPAPVGTVHPAPHPWEGLFLLETTWGHALAQVGDFLVYNEARGRALPLEYRFYSSLLWGWSVAEDRAPAWPILSRPPNLKDFSRLLGSRYLASWFLENEALYGAVEPLLSADLSRPDSQLLLTMTALSLAESQLPAEVCLRYARRLRQVADWLVRGGEGDLAAVAAAAAQEVETARPLESSFALALLQKGLLVALGNLRQEGLR